MTENNNKLSVHSHTQRKIPLQGNGMGVISKKNSYLNKTDLQPVSRPVEKIIGFFQEVKKVTKKVMLP